MKFKIPGNVLARVASRAKRCSWQDKANLIYKFARLTTSDGLLVVDATESLWTWLRQSAAVEDDRPGVAIVSAIEFASAASHFAGEERVTGELQEKAFQLSAGRKKLKLQIGYAPDFPEPPEEPSTFHKLPVAATLSALRECDHARSKNEGSIVQSAFVRVGGEKIQAIAIDGKRMASAVYPNAVGADVFKHGEFIVPMGACERVTELFAEEEEFAFATTKTHFVCKTKHDTLFASLPSGNYPAVDRHLETAKGSIARFETKTLVDALALLKLAGNAAALEVTEQGASFDIKSETQAHAECSVLSFRGKPTKCAINVSNWLDYIRATGASEIFVEFEKDDDLTPQTLRPVGREESCGVISAMRGVD